MRLVFLHDGNFSVVVAIRLLVYALMSSRPNGYHIRTSSLTPAYGVSPHRSLPTIGRARLARPSGAFASLQPRPHILAGRPPPTTASPSMATSTSTSTTKVPLRKNTATLSAPKGKSAADPAKKKGKAGSGSESSKKVLVIVESPAKARTISQLLKKAGGGRFDGYTVDACNGHVTDLVGKRKDVPPELKEKTKKWDVVGVDVVSPSPELTSGLRAFFWRIRGSRRHPRRP